LPPITVGVRRSVRRRWRRRSVRRTTALSGRVAEGMRPAPRAGERREGDSGFGPVARHEHGGCSCDLFPLRTKEIRRAPDGGDGKARSAPAVPAQVDFFLLRRRVLRRCADSGRHNAFSLRRFAWIPPRHGSMREPVTGVTHPNRDGLSTSGRAVLNRPYGLKVSRTADDMGVVGFLFEDVLRHERGQSERSD
jgi:hypothetical protein